MDSVSGISFGGLTSGIDAENYRKQDMQDGTATVGLHDGNNIDLMRNSSIKGETCDFMG